MKYWKCSICGTKNKEKANYHENLGLSFSLHPYRNICIKCYNKLKDKELKKILENETE